MRKYSKFIAVAFLIAVMLASCTGTGAPSKSIKVTMTDFSFSPNTFTVPAGEQIALDVTNAGAVQHSFLIMKLGHQAQGHFSEADKANIYWEQDGIPPGEKLKESFTAPGEAGEYQILCGITGHLEAGMVAKLIVVSKP